MIQVKWHSRILKDFLKAGSGKTRESRDVLERKSEEQRLLLDNIKTPKRNLRYNSRSQCFPGQ